MKTWRPSRIAKVTRRVFAAFLLLTPAWGNAETEREPDITVVAERVGKWEMSFEDMEFVNRAISCGKRLYSDGQKRAAWPYIKMGARYGDIDSQFIASNMLISGGDVPKDWNAAVGWLGVAAEGNIKPLAQKRLRESKETLCGGRADCEQGFDDIVADYRSRYGRRATGMACRLVKRTPGLSIRISRGSRRVTCKFSRLLPASGILADADLEAVMGTGMAPGIGPVLATAYPGRLGFVVRNPRGPGTRRLRCPDLGD